MNLSRKVRKRVVPTLAAFWILMLPACTAQKTAGPAESAKRFQPRWKSIQKHEVPQWFHDAKFGIMICWGLYSVPAWATPTGELGKVDPDVWFVNNPYAEWYYNTMRIEGSPTQKYHEKTYGKDFEYRDFGPIFVLRRGPPGPEPGQPGVAAHDPPQSPGIARKSSPPGRGRPVLHPDTGSMDADGHCAC